MIDTHMSLPHIPRMTLDEYLSSLPVDGKLTDAEFGAKVGVSQSHVSRLRRGIYRPSWKTMEAIERETAGKVRPTFEDWPVKVEVA